MNFRSLILDFAPAKRWYSSTTEDKHQFCNFLKQPTRQPVRCCNSNVQNLMSKSFNQINKNSNYRVLSSSCFFLTVHDGQIDEVVWHYNMERYYFVLQQPSSIHSCRIPMKALFFFFQKWMKVVNIDDVGRGFFHSWWHPCWKPRRKLINKGRNLRQ